MGGWARSSQDAESDAILLPLPPGFRPIKEIWDGDIKPGTLVNVCGIVTDFRPPIATAKKDWKAEITLYDISTETDNETIELCIFRPRDNIPLVEAGDVLLLFKVKAQSYAGTSLITHHQTIILVFSAKKIPKYPKPVPKDVKSAKSALKPKTGKELVKAPTEVESTYVTYFYNRIDKGNVPEPQEFELMTTQALNVKEKFSLLKDIEENRFCDLIVRVCRDPYVEGDRVTLYVSDYTENASFFDLTPTGVQDLDYGVDDPYSYGSTRGRINKSSNEWVGPYGKRTLQVTCWEPHATFIQEEVTAGDWIRLRNVQPRMARDGSYLEGAMREERGVRNTDRVNVTVFDLRDKDLIEPKLKDALQRCRDYMSKNNMVEPKRSKGKRNRAEEESDDSIQRGSKNARRRKARAEDTDDSTEQVSKSVLLQLAALQAEGAGETSSSKPNNSKARRLQKRREAEQRAEEQQAKSRLGLNPLILCENPPDGASVRVASLFEQHYLMERVVGHQVRLPLPFVNAKQCVDVRVVDFHPPQLQDFARPREKKASGSSSESEDYDYDTPSSSRKNAAWEWLFALQLEDINPKAEEPSRVWVVVNNMDAQYLTNLDASDLRRDKDNLNKLRQKMFNLWGELEEQKHWLQSREAEARKRKPGQAPPPMDSDDEGEGRRLALMKNAPPVTSNEPFTCCVQQYGVKTPENDPLKADAGTGYRWERTFALCGTKISS